MSEDKPIMEKKARKKKSKIYFGTPVQEAIIRYQNTKSQSERNKLMIPNIEDFYP